MSTPKRLPRWVLWIPVALGLGAVGLMGWVAWAEWRRQADLERFFRDGTRTAATVRRYDSGSEIGGDSAHGLEFKHREEVAYEFRVDGRGYTGKDERAGRGGPLVPRLKPGDRAEVVYDPARPEVNRLADRPEESPDWQPFRWVNWLLLGPVSAVLIFVLFLLAVAVALGLRNRTRSPNHAEES